MIVPAFLIFETSEALVKLLAEKEILFTIFLVSKIYMMFLLTWMSLSMNLMFFTPWVTTYTILRESVSSLEICELKSAFCFANIVNDVSTHIPEKNSKACSDLRVLDRSGGENATYLVHKTTLGAQILFKFILSSRVRFRLRFSKSA